MISFNTYFDRITEWMEKHGIFLLRFSMGIIFIWFGALKPFGLSPASGLVEKTVFWWPSEIFIPVLGVWEVVIGICLIVPQWTKTGLILLFLQMSGTFLPLILLPEVCFKKFPFVLTMEGQYIVKNLVLVSAGIVIGGALARRHL